MEKDYLNMSDEDFAKETPSDIPRTEAKAEPEKVLPEPVVVEPVKETVADEPVAVVDDPDVKPDDDTTDPDKTADPDKTEEDPTKIAEAKTEADKTKIIEPNKTDVKVDPAAKEAVKTEPEPIDYEDFYKKILTPFKANGKEIKLNTPEEAIRLMQMGAGFGRKLQDLQPHLKTIKMLEKADLLDEAKLSRLIDIQNKNPEAIKALIKESGIDPLDLNVEDNVTYTPTDHSVKNDEFAFSEALDEVSRLPEGPQTLKVINDTWDQESKNLLWNSPELLGVIQTQRVNGLYDQITTEIDRQKLLGHIPNQTPLLQAYKIAGDYLQANNLFKINPVEATPAKVVATTTGKVKSPVANSEAAKAASSTPSTTRKASVIKNPLEMADEEFMKQFNGRL